MILVLFSEKVQSWILGIRII